MLPVEKAYGSWAASGEIDILEYRGNSLNTVSGSIHYWSEWPHDRYVSRDYTLGGNADLSTGFHDYALDWIANPVTGRPLEMRWSVDGTVFLVQDLSKRYFFPSPLGETYPPGTPWDQHFYLILNLAVGGNFFSGAGLGEMRTTVDYDTANANWENPTLLVEHVRVWTQPGFEERAVV